MDKLIYICKFHAKILQYFDTWFLIEMKVSSFSQSLNIIVIDQLYFCLWHTAERPEDLVFTWVVVLDTLFIYSVTWKVTISQQCS